SIFLKPAARREGDEDPLALPPHRQTPNGFGRRCCSALRRSYSAARTRNRWSIQHRVWPANTLSILLTRTRTANSVSPGRCGPLPRSAKVSSRKSSPFRNNISLTILTRLFNCFSVAMIVEDEELSRKGLFWAGATWYI